MSQTLRVLIVEHDQIDARRSLRELRKAGFRAEADIVATRQELVSRLANKNKEYAVILADYRMPDWTGLDALAIVQQMNLDIPFVLVAGAKSWPSNASAAASPTTSLRITSAVCPWP
jgi:CheY-like chemotaxis protein